jgi:hypothetical protein
LLVISGLIVKNCFENSLLVITKPFEFHTVSLRVLFGICSCSCPVPGLLLLLLRSTAIAKELSLPEKLY